MPSEARNNPQQKPAARPRISDQWNTANGVPANPALSLVRRRRRRYLTEVMHAAAAPQKERRNELGWDESFQVPAKLPVPSPQSTDPTDLIELG
ncbi:hypothetical protein CORC01_07758 [Colletotrichum orchidophilum]|uniref:Uncharacterized protein n=1 Tax=Colletotrichum orchidophilum TaxID=1209926 RepID=A0A1G4B6N2_9PEZI|nr:uncharacterized protein CORC01_07758 [Colletotrichum orchidophilum]OHE96973.1 hypothetical protein CORC01_07758 [Colletotrichum orchidophilum]